MVILQFNKLIRNKWVWGVFAVLVSIAFVAPDDWFRGDDSAKRGDEALNKLSAAPLDKPLREKCEHLVRDFLPRLQPSPLTRCFEKNSARDVWKAYAAALAAKKAGYTVSDDALAARIVAMFPSPDGGFSAEAYRGVVARAFGVEAQTFEGMLRLWMSIEGLMAGVAETSAWIPPQELEQTERDYTDRLTVRVAEFKQDGRDANTVTVDDEGLKKWYDANSASLALPERFKLRFVKFDPDASNVVDKVSVSEEAIAARYEENKDKGLYDFTEKDGTNEVKSVKALADVRESIEKTLVREAAVEWLKEDLKRRTAIDEDDEEAVKALVANVAADTGLEVKESDWFSLAGTAIQGFTTAAEYQFPGVNRREFERTVRSLIDYSFGMLSSPSAVWLVELAERSPAHIPSFEESKEAIRVPALRDARLDAFKADVAKVAAGGVDAVLATENVSTNLVFAPCDFGKDYAYGWVNTHSGEWDFQKAGFRDAEKIVFAARSLEKGAMSDFVSLSPGKAAIVVCIDRKDGDPADLVRGERFARMLAMRRQGIAAAFSGWLDANLERMGYRETPSAAAADAE